MECHCSLGCGCWKFAYAPVDSMWAALTVLEEIMLNKNVKDMRLEWGIIGKCSRGIGKVESGISIIKMHFINARYSHTINKNIIQI